MMMFSAIPVTPWWCFACLVCGGAPDWPENGLATREWVEDALEWRLDRGAGACEEYMPAIDAWTLEWIAESDEIRVEINTEEWPVFTSEPMLQGTLIQIMALEQLQGLDFNDERILRKLKRVARRSEGGISEELELVFKENKNLQGD